jgi:hypothetical protein
VSEHLALLLRLHDGDDRCGCLRKAVIEAMGGCSVGYVEEIVEDCLRSHPAGSRYRA